MKEINTSEKSTGSEVKLCSVCRLFPDRMENTPRNLNT